ncbi:MAG: hypothetical protein H6Q60_919 [Oscillospiraceae bacterium]|nr:hypothetical protein [Oscillospiraceae bacterium]
MNQLLKLQVALLKLINEQEGRMPEDERDETLDWERLHMASCARLGWIMAQEAGENPQLAACACAIHDIGRILTGKQAGHAERGYEPAKVFLRQTGLFSAEEVELLATAVKNHSNKSEVGHPIEEIVKNADVVDCFQYGLPFAREEQRLRYETWISRHCVPG